MSEDAASRRGGEGKIVSPTDAKASMGRSFQRIHSSGGHTGNGVAKPTEWAASEKLAKGEPTQTEIKMVFESNPHEVSTYKLAGMNDLQIYDILKDR